MKACRCVYALCTTHNSQLMIGVYLTSLRALFYTRGAICKGSSLLSSSVMIMFSPNPQNRKQENLTTKTVILLKLFKYQLSTALYPVLNLSIHC